MSQIKTYIYSSHIQIKYISKNILDISVVIQKKHSARQL